MFLKENNLDFIIISPLASAKVRQSNIRSTKTDQKDCKNIAKKIKDISFTKDVILTFQDLIMYGYYNDKIFSVDVISHISSIFGHRRWVQPFFLAISLYSGNKIDIPELTSSSEEVCKAVINPKTYKNYDLVIEAIKYLDSIYDTLVDRESVR